MDVTVRIICLLMYNTIVTLPIKSGIFTDVSSKKPRSSNLELYRIVCMLMIVSHHYVVNSGLISPEGPIYNNPSTPNSIFLLLFGAWGKVGINCFLMITGYFMCTSKITMRKFFKLLLQVYFFKFLFYTIFLAVGYETLSLVRLTKLVMPFWNIKDGFVGCFLVFYLTIPFWNILIKNMTKHQHTLLLVLLVICYMLLGSLPFFDVRFNYVTWFGIIYLIASYIRLYPVPIYERCSLWGLLTLVFTLLGIGSVLCICFLIGRGFYFFLMDSNKVLAVAIAVCSFLWFKNIPIKQSKVINAFGASTFGVLLIHANSDAMRTWLWKDFVDCVGHYSLPFGHLVFYSVGVVLAIFIVCNIIDQIRIGTIEKFFFRWYDKQLSRKAKSFSAWLTDNK